MREDGRHARVNEVQAGSLPGITFYSILYARTSITIQMVMPWEQHLKFLPMHPKMVSANCYCNAQIKKKNCIRCHASNVVFLSFIQKELFIPIEGRNTQDA